MSGTPTEEDLVLRPSPVVRGVAAALVVAGVALPVLTGLSGGAVMFGLGFVILGIVGCRVGIRVGAAGVVLNSGLRTQRIAWTDIEGFRVQSGSNGGVCILVSGGEVTRLPWEELRVIGTKSRRAQLCTQLEEIRARYKV